MSVDVGEFKCAYDGNHGPAIARVNPFLITRYTMSRDAYAEWLPAFRKSHSRILHDYLKIKDLCCDDPVPF